MDVLFGIVALMFAIAVVVETVGPYPHQSHSDLWDMDLLDRYQRWY